MDEFYKGWVVRYKKGFITKTVDYINTLGDNNQVVSKKEYRYQVWFENALFFDSFLDTSDGYRLILNWKEETGLDPDHKYCQTMQDYQHEIDIDALIDRMNDHFIWGIDMGVKTHKVDGTPVRIPYDHDQEPYGVTHYDNEYNPRIYWNASCGACGGDGKVSTYSGQTESRCYCVGVMNEADENMKIMVENGDITITSLESGFFKGDQS